MSAEKPRAERVRVHCRVRPGTVRESHSGMAAACAGNTVTINQKSFELDSVFDPDASQQSVYDEVAAPTLQSVLSGYNGTILAYGQTGSGKTHTLLNASDDSAQVGLVPRLAVALFVAIRCDVQHVYSVRATFAQIYNESVDDLLKGRPGAAAAAD
eukprot:5435833-Prymnesium_polylepis.1